MKISVITLHIINNYGSALQTYATQTVLQKLGHSVEFVDYWRKNATIDARIDNLLETRVMKKFKPLWDINSITRLLVRIPLKNRVLRQRKNIQSFLNKYLQFTEPYYSNEQLMSNPPKADVYITGSDQVWNSIWNEGIDEPYFLSYAPDDKKKIAFAASIGRTKLDESEILAIKPALSRYDSISMREASGVELLNQIGVDAVQILDPTLMITEHEWKRIAKFPKKRDPYLVVYQLNDNKDMDDYSVKIAEMKGWDIIRLGYGSSEKRKPGKAIIRPSVEELLGYMMLSELVLTDSFHMTSFALNCNKPFITVMPPRFSTRLESILDLTETDEQMLRSFDDYSIVSNRIDFNRVKSILDAEREKGIAWLNNAINS